LPLNSRQTIRARQKTIAWKRDDGSDARGIGGAKGLTDWHIRRMQGHYGAAIRENAGSLEKMTTAVWAIYHHRRGDHSECSDKCPAVHSKDLAAANKSRLPNFIMDKLKPVFEDLACEKLLKRCVHGGTQNNNESFHHLIWERCPKTVFASLPRLKVAVYDAIITFNEGERSALNLFQDMNFESVGSAAAKWAVSADRKRLDQSILQGAALVKSARKAKAIADARRMQQAQDQEGIVYKAGGGFD
jgi:hypothetical protein